MSLSSLKSRWIPAMLILLAVATTVPFDSALAGHGDSTLPGSNFEIDIDANLMVDHAAPPSLDWAGVSETRKTDQPSGQNDDSFAQGAKEDTVVPNIETGSIPPNKSDLTNFGIFQEGAGGSGFLHLFWTRVQEPVGTTNMDFEFNQSTTISANGVTPVRTPGDLLVVYELSKGGTVPELFLFTWLDGSEGLSCDASNSYPCWGDRTDLDAAGGAAGSVNTSAIAAADSDGLGNLQPITFGEASINLDFIFDDESCTSFGYAYLKSRSSDSFTAAMKDFIAPESVNITNCGTVIVHKETDPDGSAGSFDFTTTVATDPADGDPFSLSDDGMHTISNVLSGTGYTVTESGIATGFDLVDIDCSASTDPNLITNTDLGTGTVNFNMTVGETVECTFTNQARGNIVIAKVTDPAGDPATFDFSGDVAGTLGHGESASAEVTAGSYSSTETVPAGWDLTDINCDDANSSGDPGTATATFNVEAGETVTCTFTNVKRGTIIVEKQTNPDGAAGAFTFTGDASGEIGDGEQIVVGNLLPGDYTSTEADPTSDGFRLDSIVCDDANSSGDLGTRTATFSLDPGETVTCTFTNSTGAIEIAKTAKNAAEGGEVPQAGVTFDVSGTEVVTDADGAACVDGLVPGVQYTVTETVPAGYQADLTDSQMVEVTAGATCDPGTPEPDQVSFLNNPLSEITITFNSLAGPGVTVVTSVTCTGPSADGSQLGPLDHAETATLTDLLEGEYTCVIFIDP